MEKTRVAVIGLGSVAQMVHLPNLMKIKNSEISSVAEISKNRLNQVADKFNIKNLLTHSAQPKKPTNTNKSFTPQAPVDFSSSQSNIK